MLWILNDWMGKINERLDDMTLNWMLLGVSVSLKTKRYNKHIFQLD